MRFRENLATALLCLGLSGCAGSDGLFEAVVWCVLTNCDEEPDPPEDRVSDLSFFDYRGEQGSESFSLASGTLVVINGEVHAVVSGSSRVFVGYGEEHLVSRESDYILLEARLPTTDQPISRVTGWTDWSERTNSIGGATDSFTASTYVTITYLGSRTLPGSFVVHNTDGSSGNGQNHVTILEWDASTEYTSHPEIGDAEVRIIGTSAFGDQIDAIYPGWLLPVSGTAVYSGYFDGVFMDAGAELSASGTVSFEVDFDDQTVSGRVSEIEAGSQSLQDVIFIPSEPIPIDTNGFEFDGYTGIATTELTDPAQTGPDMEGAYIIRVFGPEAEEAGGSTALSGSGAGLVGSFVGSR